MTTIFNRKIAVPVLISLTFAILFIPAMPQAQADHTSLTSASSMTGVVGDELTYIGFISFDIPAHDNDLSISCEAPATATISPGRDAHPFVATVTSNTAGEFECTIINDSSQFHPRGGGDRHTDTFVVTAIFLDETQEVPEPNPEQEIFKIEEKLDGQRESLITAIVNTLGEVGDAIGQVLGILEDPEIGLGEIKREVSNIEDTVGVNFPQAGIDRFQSIAKVQIVDIPNPGDEHFLTLTGPVVVQRSDPFTDSGTGLRTIDTEILSMDLVGSSSVGPVTVKAGSSFGLPPTTGKVTQLSSGSDFPADSFFDVFFEVEISGTPLGTLTSSGPVRVLVNPQNPITAIPPINTPYEATSCDPLLDSDGNTVGGICILAHIPTTPTGQIIKEEIIDLERKLDDPNFGLQEIKREVAIIEDTVAKERVSVTVHLDGVNIKKGEVMVLLDTTDSGKLSVVHVAANLPCTKAGPANTPNVLIKAGEAIGTLSDVIESAADDTGFVGPKNTCVFHDTVTSAVLGHDITDIILINVGAPELLNSGTVITITGTYE